MSQALNYTINRPTQPQEDYGCTNFSTIQLGGDVASTLPGATLDGSIYWQAIAAQGYYLDVADFSIQGANCVVVGNTKTCTGGTLPAEVLAVTFTKNGNDLDIYIYLGPDAAAGIAGLAYEMPFANVLMQIQIVGCATYGAKNLKVQLKHPDPSNFTVTTSNLHTALSSSSSSSAGTTTLELTGEVTGNNREEPVKLIDIKFDANSSYYLNEGDWEINQAASIGVSQFGAGISAPEAVNKTHSYFVEKEEVDWNDIPTMAAYNRDGDAITAQYAPRTLNYIKYGLYVIINSNIDHVEEADKIIHSNLSATAVETNPNSIKSLSLIGDIKQTEGQYILDTNGGEVGFSLTGDGFTTGGNLPTFGIYINFLPDINPGFAYWNFDTQTWVDSIYKMDGQLVAERTGISSYPSFKSNTSEDTGLANRDRFGPNNRKVASGETQNSSVFSFAPSQFSYELTTVSGNSNLTLSEDMEYDNISYSIVKGTTVSGTGIAANSKVLSRVGRSIVLDTPMTGSATNTITFVNQNNYYDVWLVPNTAATTPSTTLGANVPDSTEKLRLNQYHKRQVTINAYSRLGAFGSVSSGASATYAVNSNFEGITNYTNSINVSITVTPSGGKTLTTVKETFTDVDLVGLAAINKLASASAQSYIDSKFIVLPDTDGISPGMEVVSSKVLTTPTEYPIKFYKVEDEAVAFTSTNTNLLTVNDLVFMADAESFEVTPAGTVTHKQLVFPKGTIITERSSAVINSATVQLIKFGFKSGSKQKFDPKLIKNLFSTWSGKYDNSGTPIMKAIEEPDTITHYLEVKSAATSVQIPAGTKVESVDSSNRITISRNVTIAVDDTLEFKSPDIELKNNTFTVTEDGANRIITGTVLVNKVGSKNSELLIDLDELITEA